MAEKSKVLVIDDEERFGQNMVKILTANGLDARYAQGGEAGLADLAENPRDVVLLDMKMPGMDGKETLRRIRASGSKAKVVILTGHASVDDAVELINMGAHDYLLKPCQTPKLLTMVSLAHDQKILEEKDLS